MNRAAIGLASALLLVGCIRDDLAAPFGTEFNAIASDRFEYVAQTTPDDPAGSAVGENVRLRFLERYLKQNGLCESGYVVDSRKAPPELNKRHPGYGAGRIRYQIHCVPSG